MPMTVRGVVVVNTDDIDQILNFSAVSQFMRDEALRTWTGLVVAAMAREGKLGIHEELVATGDKKAAGAVALACMGGSSKADIAEYQAARRECMSAQDDWLWSQAELAKKDPRAIDEVCAKYQRIVDEANANGTGAQTNG